MSAERGMTMTKQELQDLKQLIMNYRDPLRGKVLSLIAYVEIVSDNRPWTVEEVGTDEGLD